MNKIRKFAVCAGAFLLAAGCADLEVENPNAPDTRRVLSAPADVLGLVGSSYRAWWLGAHSYNGAGPALSVASDAHTASWGNFAMQDFSKEPREAINNNPSYGYSVAIEYSWKQNYATLKAVNDGLRAMDVDGVSLGADEPMVRAFAKFMQGLAHGQLALLYDQAFVYDETVGPEEIQAGLELKPYGEVMQAALGYLQESITLAQGASFTTPSSWINGVELSSAELVQLAHSYMARYMAGVARNPTERAAVDWNSVISHADQGITQEFGPMGDGLDQWWDGLKAWGGTFGGWGRQDLRFLGMADTDGDYQKWIAAPSAERNAFLINTPDRRVTGDTPTSNGTHIKYFTSIPFRPERGTWHFSNYGDNRWAGGFNNYSSNFTDRMVEFFPRELKLLKAEGLMRTGNAAAAADIVNETRLAAGLLPVTADGVPGVAPNCVPQEPTATPQCGTLLRAIQWEKWLETYHTGMPTEFTDARGWGFLQKGTPVHLPVPGAELQVLEMPIYTFGGTGEGAAPSVGVNEGGVLGSVSAAEGYFESLKSRTSPDGRGSSLRRR